MVQLCVFPFPVYANEQQSLYASDTEGLIRQGWTAASRRRWAEWYSLDFSLALRRGHWTCGEGGFPLPWPPRSSSRRASRCFLLPACTCRCKQTSIERGCLRYFTYLNSKACSNKAMQTGILWELEAIVCFLLLLKSLNAKGRDELQGKEDKVTLTDDRASSEVWPAPFASLCSDAVAQPASHALQARDRPLFPCYLWPGTPEVHIISGYFYQ